MKNFSFLSFIATLILTAPVPFIAHSQSVTLNADGPGNTYELINGAFDPGNSAVESPDCVHGSFGRHVAEVFDAELNKNVFEFYSHVAFDNDRCIVFDRQRMEITTTPSSPSNLKATTGETVTYKWRFKLPAGFQPSSSFTHIHQVKAVAGDESSPIFTLTPRKGTPNTLELIHVLDSNSGTTKLAIVPLSIFEGIWVEATEVIKAGTAGTYSIILKKVSDGTTLFSYSNVNILTERASNSFIRPKWGIYRSITSASDLRDESMRFSDFTIAEGSVPLSANIYYWVGGTSLKNFATASNWNTQLNGSGSSRSVAGALPDDILIVDGSNVGGSTPVTGTVTATISSNTIGQLKLQNNAVVVFQKATPVPPATAGSGTLTIGGDGTAAPDFEVLAGSSLTLNSPATDGNVNIALPANATGLIAGTITLSNTGMHRITSQTTDGLVFKPGATFNSAGTTASAAYPFGSSSQGVQFAVKFETGSNLIVTGNNSPMGGTSSFQSCDMMPGSNYYVRTSNAGANGSYSNSKIYGNIFIENNSTFTSDGAFYKIDTLTIATGSSLITHTSGNTPVLGNLLVNGVLSAPAASSNTLVMGGKVAQAISGTGTIVIPSLTVANYSDVTLSKSLTVSSSCNIVGKINFGTASQLTGTSTFTSRTSGAAVAVTGNTTAGSYQVTNVVGTLSGNTGLAVKGTGIDANTNVIATSSGNAVIMLSKPALSTTTGSIFTFTSDSATLVTANPNGMDTLTGSVTVTGSKSFQGGTNYIFNGATSKPFGISSGSTGTVIKAGTVEINAPVTVNRGLTVYRQLTINNKLTLRPLDVVLINTGAVINGNYNASNYIVTDYNTATGEQSTVRLDGITSSVTFPIGTTNNYLPVTFNPSSVTTLTAAVFEGITSNGAITGVPFTASNRQSVVNAVWNINRLTGAGSSSLKLNWNNVLEGTTFSTSSSADIGLIENNGTVWSAPSGVGDNAANSVTKTITTYGPFSIGSVPSAIAFVFNPLPAKTYGDADFSGGASSLNTTQPIVYTSNNTSVATIVSGNIHIVAAGAADITASQAGDGTYPAASVTKTLTVNKAALTITADNKTKSQGEANPALTLTYAGFVLGETASVLLSPAVPSTTAVTTSPIGTYPITVSGATASNYNISFVNGTLTVLPKQNQTITFNPLPVKTYGNADFAIGATSTNAAITITYVSSNTSVAAIVGNSIHIVGAGTSTITASQAGNAAYLAASDVSQTFTVNKASLSIKVNDTTKTQGQANPQFTFTYTGFVLGDTAATLTTLPAVATLATINSAPGNYIITPEGAVAANYSITYIGGSLTIFPSGGNGQQSFNAYLSNSTTLTVSVFSVQPALGDIIIYDVLGRPLMKKNFFIPAGFISTTMQVASIPSGIYVVVIKGSGVDLGKKIYILK